MYSWDVLFIVYTIGILSLQAIGLLLNVQDPKNNKDVKVLNPINLL
jgi:hypothetical protein